MSTIGGEVNSLGKAVPSVIGTVVGTGTSGGGILGGVTSAIQPLATPLLDTSTGGLLNGVTGALSPVASVVGTLTKGLGSAVSQVTEVRNCLMYKAFAACHCEFVEFRLEGLVLDLV